MTQQPCGFKEQRFIGIQHTLEHTRKTEKAAGDNSAFSPISLKATGTTGRSTQSGTRVSRQIATAAVGRDATMTQTTVSTGVTARRYLRSLMYNVHCSVQCTLVDTYRPSLERQIGQ